MEYNLSEDILDIIKQKTLELFNKLEKTQPENFLEDFKLFHNDSRTNTTLLKFIIHKKLNKIDNIILIDELKEYEDNQEITDYIWDYIHSVYLLYEYALPDQNKEILSALIKKINIVENNTENNTNELVVFNKNNLLVDAEDAENAEDTENVEDLDDVYDKFKEKKEFKIFNDVLGSIAKNMNIDIDTKNTNTNLINEIMDDIKTNINNSEDVDDLFNSSKNIGEKYKNMFEEGKISMNDLMSGMMNVMANPKNITESMKDIDVKKIPDMNSIMNKLVTEVSTNDDLKGMMKTDMFKNMNLDPNNKDFNPMDIISNMMSNMSNNDSNNTSSNETPLTNEQITEMEIFYSNLNIGKE